MGLAEHLAAVDRKAAETEQELKKANDLISQLQADLAFANKEIHSLSKKLEIGTKEKDFYFNRCREIEHKFGIVGKIMLDVLDSSKKPAEFTDQYAPKPKVEGLILEGMANELIPTAPSTEQEPEKDR